MATVYEVENGLIKMRASNRSCPGCPEAILVASTFPLVPNGTVVYELTIKAPEGMHVVLFRTVTTQPRVIGHGKTIKIDPRIEVDGGMLFIWKEGDKTIAKVEEYLKPIERGIFNPCVMHKGELTISDNAGLVVYHTSENPETSDPKWTYKRVSPDDAVRYVAKMITLAELDALSDKGVKIRNEIDELRAQVETLQYALGRHQAAVQQLTADNNKLTFRNSELERVGREMLKQSELFHARRLSVFNAVDDCKWIFRLIMVIPKFCRPPFLSKLLAIHEETMKV